MNEFKVGDWVRHIESNNIYKINGFSMHGQTKGFIQIPDEYNLVPQSECELWQPKEGEWCWFWDNFNNPFIGKFVARDGDNYQYKHTKNDKVYSAYKCEPFVGELPTFLKDK